MPRNVPQFQDNMQHGSTSRKLGDGVAILCSSISKLEKSLNWHKMEIKQKNEILSNLDRQLNEKSNALEEKLNRDGSTTTQMRK